MNDEVQLTGRQARDNDKKAVHVAEVVRHGDKLILPETMGIDSAIDLLQRQKKYDDEPVLISRTIPVFPWDGALALMKAMETTFGWVNAEPIPSFFGPQPPQLIQIEVGPNRFATIAWGEFSVPGIEGRIKTSYTQQDGVICFVATAKVKRTHERAINQVFDLATKLALSNSIYRGQAISIRFKGDDGDIIALPMPKFLDLSKVKDNELIFSRDVEAAFSTNLLTPIQYSDACRRAGIPLKRGILFEGPYGTGKTLAAYVTAKTAVQNSWTYLYCERADELSGMVRFARQYQPAVIFCEDIDRVMSGERSVQMDELLNIVDGISTKSCEIIVVVTTNHVEKLNPAMLRPGRLDAVIHVSPPDAEAVGRLLRVYSRGNLVVDTPEAEHTFAQACEQLAGKVPAAIRECVERARLSALKLSSGMSLDITPNALLDSAISLDNQLALIEKNSRPSDEYDAIGIAVTDFLRMTGRGDISKRVNEVTKAAHKLLGVID